ADVVPSFGAAAAVDRVQRRCGRCNGMIPCPRETAWGRPGDVMKLPRRKFLYLAAGGVALPAISRTARAQTYPTRPVRLVVGFDAGGAADILARLMGQWLSERLGQQFVIENRSGASGTIAAEAVARAAPDGYTLLLVTSTDVINATLYEKLNFDFIRDIVPVASITRAPHMMVVHPLFPAKTVPEFIPLARATPRKGGEAQAKDREQARRQDRYDRARYDHRRARTLDEWRRSRDSGDWQRRDAWRRARYDDRRRYREREDLARAAAAERSDLVLRRGRSGPFGATSEKLGRGCAAQAAEFENWPFDAIERAAGPDETQRNAMAAVRVSGEQEGMRV